jgi:predicted ATPase/class 3 adenylate cyclase/predicted enzyme related to lactoylglutathione lyase
MAEREELPPEHLKSLLARIDPAILQQLMPLTGGVVTMMFTDIVNSTAIKAGLGDETYFNDVLEPHNRLVRERIAAHHGRELKTIGDAFLVGFALPREAVDCAVDIQQRLAAAPILADGTPLEVRIGLHTGSPRVYRDPVSALIDLSGTDVDKAARIEALARGGQILISEETHVLVKPQAHDWGLWELKGLGRHRVFEALWPGKAPGRPSGRASLEPVRFLTSFVGRESELSTAMSVVAERRLVTLRGPGGIGKTRLAEEIAARVAERFDDGAHVVELAQTADSETAVALEVLRRLEVEVEKFPDELTALTQTLRSRRALVVLDNFEGVMSAASLVDKLLRRCPGLHLLVTSQELLGVDGEQQLEVTAMPTAATASVDGVDALAVFDSFKLFQDRARLQKPDWSPGPADARVVAEILESTDGIPLLIELAAAWVDRIALRTLRDGLSQRRSAYLRRSGSGIAERRHASSEACLDWSFNLLAPEEQRLFARLSVFVGGCFPSDVAAVCEEDGAAVLLDSLRGRSLLSSGESSEQTRYQMLPTIREYAARKLGPEGERLRRRHAGHFLQVLDRADDQIQGAEQFVGFDRITADLENIRAGMNGAVAAADHPIAVRYAQAFATYLRLTAKVSEGLERARQGLKSAEALNDSALIASCQNNLGIAYRNLPTGDRGENLQRAIACYEAALGAYTEREFPMQWASIQNNLGITYEDLPTGERAANLQRAIACYEAALRVRTEREFPMQWARTQNNLGGAYGDLPTGERGANLQRAMACYEAALRVYTEREFPMDWAMTQNNLGNAYRGLPTGNRDVNLQRAMACYEAALRVYTERGFPMGWAETQNNLGLAYGDLPSGGRGENLQRAIACYEAALRVRTEHEFPMGWAETQNNLGLAYGSMPTGDRGENRQGAIACYEAALRVRTEHESPMGWAETQENLGIAYGDPPTGHLRENFQRVIACFEAAIRGYQSAGLIDDAERVRRRLEEAERQRSQ